MKVFPRSIRGRLLVAGLFFTGIALIVAALSIGEVLDRFVRRSLDERLDAQIALLVRAVRSDGTVDATMLQEIGPFTQHRRGWGWHIETPKLQYSSQEIVKLYDVKRGPEGVRSGRFRGPVENLRSGRTEDSYVRTLERKTSSGLIRISVAAPKWVFYRSRQAVITPVLMALAGLSFALLVTIMLQLHIGLKPLKRLRTALAGVRAGTLDRVPEEQPLELVPVVTELNALLDENEAALARARSHVSNLAHSLKTPLATLSIRLAELDCDPKGELTELVGQVDGAIRHHLARARSASPGAPGQPQISVETAVDELLQALGRIYADKNITFATQASPESIVKCDPQDLAEMLGNLLDNACKWARTQISVSASAEGKNTIILIDDDGPGLSDEAMEQALVPGRRLDEREEGHGFGLPIACELAELHGGSLELGRSSFGGLRAILTLPR